MRNKNQKFSDNKVVACKLSAIQVILPLCKAKRSESLVVKNSTLFAQAFYSTSLKWISRYISDLSFEASSKIRTESSVLNHEIKVLMYVILYILSYTNESDDPLTSLSFLFSRSSLILTSRSSSLVSVSLRWNLSSSNECCRSKIYDTDDIKLSREKGWKEREGGR